MYSVVTTGLAAGVATLAGVIDGMLGANGEEACWLEGITRVTLTDWAG
jgi:hypothetical protein